MAKGDIQLAIYDDRIEIWNPGELTVKLTTAQLKGKHKSIPRNQFLAEKLYLIKYIERWGGGTNRIVEEMREDKLPDPVFSNNSGGFEIGLIGPGNRFDKVIDDIKLHKIDINDRQKKAMEFIKHHGEIFRKQYVELAKVSVRQANRDLNDLLIKHIVTIVKRWGHEGVKGAGLLANPYNWARWWWSDRGFGAIETYRRTFFLKQFLFCMIKSKPIVWSTKTGIHLIIHNDHLER